MSAPDTNIETQKRRHRGPLIGIAVLLVFAGIMAVLIFWEGTDGDTDDPLVTAPEAAAMGVEGADAEIAPVAPTQ